MYHVFVDLEMQDRERQFKLASNGLRNEVIEFGAVVLDDDFKEIDSYKKYVKPEFSRGMQARFIALTGITDSMIQSANKFEYVLEDFCNWCLQYGDDICFYEWSDSDLAQLLKEAKRKCIELTDKEKQVLKNWQDVQRMYGEAVDSRTQIALETAVWTFGERFLGRAHDAVNDARNTGRVYAMLQNQKDRAMAKQMLHHGTTETSIGFTLADVFDFSKLQLAVG